MAKIELPENLSIDEQNGQLIVLKDGTEIGRFTPDGLTVPQISALTSVVLPKYDELSNAPSTEGVVVYATGDGSDDAGVYKHDGTSYAQLGGGGGGDASALDMARRDDILMHFRGAELIDKGRDLMPEPESTNRLFNSGALRLEIDDLKAQIEETFYAPLEVDVSESWYLRADIRADTERGDLDSQEPAHRFVVADQGYMIVMADNKVHAIVLDGGVPAVNETLLTGLSGSGLDKLRLEIEHDAVEGEVTFTATNLTEDMSGDYTTELTPDELDLIIENMDELWGLVCQTHEKTDGHLELFETVYSQEVSE